MRITAFLTLLGLSGLASLSVLVGPGEVCAQRAPRSTARTSEDTGAPSAPMPRLSDLPDILQRLNSTNADETRMALDELVILDRPEAIAPIAELLRRGQPDVITDHALESLKRIAEPAALDVLTEFTRHRRPGARRRAYEALSEIRDRRVRVLLEQGLRDSDRSVRAEVADSLGRIGARDSVELLFRAFERGVIEAAPAIGRLGNDESVARFTGYLGQQPLSVILEGYSEFLHRTDISEATKIEIVMRLGEVSGRLVRQFLQQEIIRLQDEERSARRRAPSPLMMRMSEVLSRIPVDAPQSRPTSGSGEVP